MCKNIDLSRKQTCLLLILTQANREEGERKGGVKSENYFLQEKISVKYVKLLATRELHARFKTLHNYCNSEIDLLFT
ncbi:hypothetical protein MTR67_014621 [Solanum verrucosum]|uniref:Uncharacterized protein n=1 Tax=Solanum verrucosum TaxID=315347 RepID=A0AAF0QIG5_SOLVR|nr:hypothetical protein MTR67_014621 [Solanum verrucosum]